MCWLPTQENPVEQLNATGGHMIFCSPSFLSTPTHALGDSIQKYEGH